MTLETVSMGFHSPCATGRYADVSCPVWFQVATALDCLRTRKLKPVDALATNGGPGGVAAVRGADCPDVESSRLNTWACTSLTTPGMPRQVRVCPGTESTQFWRKFEQQVELGTIPLAGVFPNMTASKYGVELTESQKRRLSEVSSRGRSSARTVKRALALLKADEGQTAGRTWPGGSP